jgi:hypothetical protein
MNCKFFIRRNSLEQLQMSAHIWKCELKIVSEDFLNNSCEIEITSDNEENFNTFMFNNSKYRLWRKPVNRSVFAKDWTIIEPQLKATYKKKATKKKKVMPSKVYDLKAKKNKSKA